MTDAQRLIFKTNLDKFFNIIEQEIEGKKIENTESIDLWAKNICDRYRHIKRGVNPKHQLPQEHIETLTKKLQEKEMTLDEFEQTHGRREQIIEILKSKKQNKSNIENHSIEELKKLQEQYDKEIVSLEKKHSPRYKKLYSLSDEEYKEIEEKINLAKTTRKRINDIIERKTKEENIEIIEIPEEEKQKNVETTQTRKQKRYNEKITELMKENSEKDTEIEELKKKLDDQQQSRQTEIQAYQENCEKILVEKKQELEQKYQEELERRTSLTEIKYKREVKDLKTQLETQTKVFENYKKHQAQEIERQRRELTNQLKETKERQQQVIVELLCSESDISLETIKYHLENKNIPVEGLENNLKELRNMIPGITRVIKDEETPSYSLRIDALKQLKQYKKDDIISPRISNIQDGKIEFIVRSDLHLEMINSEDTLKRRLEPLMNFCVKRNNIPIIDLGDLAETLIGIKYESWKEFDKNTAKLAYKFYKNYAKAIASAPEIMHYTLLGNHDEHPYLVGIDPLEILYEYSDNFKSLGVSKGSFRVGNDKIGVFHDKQWQNMTFYKDYAKEERDEYIYDYLCEEAHTIAKEYIYSLFGHYHFGMHNIEKRFSVINNGLENSLLFTAELKDGHVEKMFVTEVGKRDYKIEIYNRGNQYKK